MRRRRQQRGRPMRFMRIFVTLAATCSFLVTLWMLPTLLLNGPLQTSIFQRLLSETDATATAGSVSASWFSPLVVHDLVLTDTEGEPFIQVDSVATQKSLLQLLVNSRQPGVVSIQRPHVKLQLRSDGSNLEDVLRPLFAGRATSDLPTSGTIEISNGLVEVFDLPGNRFWSVHGVNLSCDVSGQSSLPTRAQLTAVVASPEGHAGKLTCDLSSPTTETSEPATAGLRAVDLQATQLPLSFLEPMIRRLDPGIRLAGLASGRVQANWTAEQTWVDLGGIELRQFEIEAPNWIGPDRLASTEIRVHGTLSTAASDWQVKGLNFESDLLRLEGQGQGTLPSSSLTASALIGAWRHGDYQLEGTLDVAKLAQVMPHTMRLRQDTLISNGQISFSVRGTRRGDAQHWDGRISTNRLVAAHQGVPIIWDQPLQLVVRAQQAHALQVHELTCRARFLEVSAQGNAQEGEVQLVGDLSQFSAELDRFVQLGDLLLAGQVRGEFRWHQDTQGVLELQGAAEAKRFEFASSSGRPWREDQLTITLAAKGSAEPNGLRRIETAALALTSGRDRFQAQLLEPVDSISWRTLWPCSFQLAGDLPTWLARLQNLVELPRGAFDGQVAFDGEAVISSDQVELRDAKLSASDFKFSGVGLTIREPIIELATTATWLPREREFRSRATTIASSSLSARADDVQARFRGDSAGASGQLGFRADLKRLQRWIQDPELLPKHQFRGLATGRVRLAYEDGHTDAEWSVEIDKLAVDQQVTGQPRRSDVQQRTWQTVWEEPTLGLEGQAQYDRERDRIELAQFEIQSQAVSVAARGAVQQPWTRAEAKLQGQVAYDLMRLSPLLQVHIGDSLRLVGRDARPFAFEGPVFPLMGQKSRTRLHQVSQSANGEPVDALAEVLAELSLAWTSGSLHGLEVGSGELNTRLSDGIVHIDPLDIEVSGGRGRLDSRLVLKGPTPAMVGDAELSGIRVTPRMCHTWLKYVAPLLADAASAQGTLSVSARDAHIPMAFPHASELRGRLAIDAAQVGAGPMVQQVLLLAQQLKATLDTRTEGRPLDLNDQWLVLPKQQFEFRMADQRIHHQKIKFVVQDVIVHTTGSVGLDQTLSLVAEVPIRDEWVSANRYLASLRGYAVKIPIYGTLSQPKLDSSALKQLGAQLLTESASDAASQFIEKEVTRGLERLFGR